MISYLKTIGISLAVMALFDRAMWRQIIIVLSASNNIGDWMKVEKYAEYQWLNPVKLALFFLIGSAIYFYNYSHNVMIIGVIVLFSVIYIYYSVHLCLKSFRRSVESVATSDESR